jgi:hypothetical protein
LLSCGKVLQKGKGGEEEAKEQVWEDSVLDFLENLHPVLQALIGTCFTWFLTAAGAAGAFLTRTAVCEFRGRRRACSWNRYPELPGGPGRLDASQARRPFIICTVMSKQEAVLHFLT